MFEEYKKLLTIGITTYNDEKFIRQTVESCVKQAGRVVICDNASSDNTGKICQELAQKYPNISYTRLDKDLGKCYGFNFVIKEAKTKYFMWCGAHDFLDENYALPMINMLENCDAAGCYPACRYIQMDGQEMGISDCWYSNRLTSDYVCERIYAFIAHLHEVYFLYGIYRTQIVKKYLLPDYVFTNMIGGDHVFMCAMALEGRLISSPRSIYNWRQTKYELNDKENLDVWKKTIAREKMAEIIKPSATRKEMCVGQLNMLKRCKSKNISEFFKKINLIRKAKKKLKKRFGY
jgi:glycosyltransferase involved in cell wall biosynthesis